MFKVSSFVKEVTAGAAEGTTGVFSLAGPPSAQFHGFVAGLGDGNATLFQVTDGNRSEAWEGTVGDGDPDQLTGTRWVGSTTGAQIDWGAGVKTITCGLDGADYLGLPGAADETELTIAAGAVTPTRASHAIDTEADAGTDDLANIATTNVRDGRWLLIRAANAARTVVVKHAATGAGQIHLAGNADFTMDNTNKWLLLTRRGADWHEVTRSFEVQSDFASGDALLFPQASAPTGWTQDTSVNDRVLRLTNSTGALTGGAWTVSGLTVQGHTLTISEIPAHTHTYRDPGSSNSGSPGGGLGVWDGSTVIGSGSVGGGGSHNHGLTSDGTWRPAYMDVIKATKD